MLSSRGRQDENNMAVEIANLCASRNAQQTEVEESRCFIDAEEPSDGEEFEVDFNAPLLRLNVGGRSFWLRPINLARAKNSVLSSFYRMTHEQRLQRANAFFDHTGEYYFERSGRLFESVFRFYATGALHRQMDVCLQEFMQEINYWGIPARRIAPCCAPRFVAKEEEEAPMDAAELRMGDWRRKLWFFCEGDGSRASITMQITSIMLILISILALILGSIEDFRVPVKQSPWLNESSSKPVMEPHPALQLTEYGCIVYFTFEYTIRLLLAPRKAAFMREALNVVDLITIVPFYLELLLTLAGIDTEQLSDFKAAILMMRILRVLRVVRILKLGRYSTGMKTFALTMKNSARQLGIMGVVFMMSVVFFSTMVYFMEEDEPDTPFTSIPAGFWWCIVTMTTVGYGDVVPTTTIGKLVGCGAILCGVLVLALPITIIVDNFTKVNATPNPFMGSRKVSVGSSSRKGSIGLL